MALPTPPLTPRTFPFSNGNVRTTSSPRWNRRHAHAHTPSISSPLAGPIEDDLELPPPMPLDSVPELDMPEPSLATENNADAEENEKYRWRPGMSREEKDARESWIAGRRGRSGLRIVIVTENFLPKVDGVTRTLARLLEHLKKEGHQCMLLGPGSGMSHYASHPLVGTAGIPLVVYPGLKLNFLRPAFLTAIKDFEPDVVHFVDPIWLGAQTLVAMELGWAGAEWVPERGPAVGTGLAGAVVASYHTNLATYATLFGLSWLEPLMWSLQRWLYAKCRLTLCPSPSTRDMLERNAFSDVRLWPRGVDLEQFGPSNRSQTLRDIWGVAPAPIAVAPLPPSPVALKKLAHGLPPTPPMSPVVAPAAPSLASIATSIPTSSPLTPISPAQSTAGSTSGSVARDERPNLVVMYVGRLSWEKNLSLLLHAFALLPVRPKLVFVGDGPARADLTAHCEKNGYDALFTGHLSGPALAAAYASADVFAFPSFTETFGQVVLEALASGLPVVGLDAEGTRDLVAHGHTGLLLPLPMGLREAKGKEDLKGGWASACKNLTTDPRLVQTYASLLASVLRDSEMRRRMSCNAATDGIRGFTWWDAMEACVDSYRESIRAARHQRTVDITVSSPPPVSSPYSPYSPFSASPYLNSSASQAPTSTTPAADPAFSPTLSPNMPPRQRRHEAKRISRVNRVVSRRLARKEQEDGPAALALKTLAKLVLALGVAYWVWTRHLGQMGRELGWDEVFRLKA